MPFCLWNSPGFSDVAFSPAARVPVTLSFTLLAIPCCFSGLDMQRKAGPNPLLMEGGRREGVWGAASLGTTAAHPSHPHRPVPALPATKRVFRPERELGKRLSLKMAPALSVPLPFFCPCFISYYQLIFHFLLLNWSWEASCRWQLSRSYDESRNSASILPVFRGL